MWPLFSVCGAALVFCGYSSYRHLAKNPEVGAGRCTRWRGAGAWGSCRRKHRSATESGSVHARARCRVMSKSRGFTACRALHVFMLLLPAYRTPLPPARLQVCVNRQGERVNGAGEMMSPQDAAAYKPSFFRNLALRRYTAGAVSSGAIGALG